MGRIRHPVYPGLRRQGVALGERLRLARLRRRMTQAEVALRANVSRLTLARLEAGELSVSLAVLFRVLGILGLAQDIDVVAGDDVLGRELQDQALRRRVPRRTEAE